MYIAALAMSTDKPDAGLFAFEGNDSGGSESTPDRDSNIDVFLSLCDRKRSEKSIRAMGESRPDSSPTLEPQQDRVAREIAGSACPSQTPALAPTPFPKV